MDPRKDQFGRCIQKVPTIITSTNCVTSQPVPQMITDRQNALSMPSTSTNQSQHSENSRTPSKSGNGSETSEALPASIQPAHGPSLSQTDKYMQPGIARTSVSHSPNRTSTDHLNTCKSDQNCITVCANSELSDSKRQSVALPASITQSRVGDLSHTDGGAVALRNAVQYKGVVNPGEQTIPPRTIPTTITSKTVVSHKGVVVAPQSSHVASQSVPPTKEDTVKKIPPTRKITTGLDPRLKTSPSAMTRSQPKSASSNSGGKPNEQSATAFQNALSDLSMALNLLAKQRGAKTVGSSPNVSASANGAHKRMRSNNESSVQSDIVPTATSLGAKFTTNPVSCSAPKSAKSPEKMVRENISRKPFQVSSQQCSPQKVMVRSPSKSPSGTQTVVRDPRLSSKLYSTIASERQAVSPVTSFHPSSSAVIGHSPVKQSSNDARYGVFSNQKQDPINRATPGATVPLPTRFSPQKRRMDTLLQPKLVFKGTSHSGMWPGSRYHLNNSSNLSSSKAVPTNISGEAKEVANLPSSSPWKTGTTTSVGSGRIREDDTSSSNTSSPTRKAPGFGYSVSQSNVTEQLPGKPNEVSKSPLSKEVRLSPNNKKTEPNVTGAGTAPLTVESKGHTKSPRSKFQKSRSFVHPRSQPSFLELLRIASRNTAKGKQVDDLLNLQDSRRRRHSDGQINKRKFSEVGSKMNPDDLSYYKIQKLEKVSGQTETVSETSRTATTDDDQRACTSVAEIPDSSVEVNDELVSAPRALVDNDGEVMRRKSSSEGEEPTVTPPTSLAASPTEAGPVLTSGELMSGNGSSTLLKSNRSPYFEKAINAAEDSHSQKNAEELENTTSSTPETCADNERDNQGSSVVPVGTSSECQAKRRVTDGDVPTAAATDTREEELQQMEEDDGASDGVDDSGSDDDDSFLMDTPSALIPDTSALVDAPMPVTPSKPSTSNMNFSPSPKVQSHLNFEPQQKKIGYTLDKMLHMKNDQELKNGDIATIRSKLMKVVSEGGIAQLASETLTEDERDMVTATEYAQYLAQCMPQLEKIPDSPPGEEIFCQEKVQQLFTPSQCLVAANWGVTRSSSVGDALCDATEDEMEEFIQTGFFDCFYSRSQIPLDIMRWMFLLMSIHPSSMESQILFNTLWGQLNKASLSLEELEFPWTPSLKDIITVMINYGGDLASLVSVSDCEVNFSEDDLRLETSPSTESRDGYWKDEEVYGLLLENHIGSVVKIITQAIITYITLKDCSGYRTEELQCLLIIMFRIALDKHILGLPVTVDISNAISTILEGFEETVWSHQVERLCLLFPLITGHHHNMVYLLQSCIPLHIERGRCLYRMLGFAGLQTLVFPEKGLCNMAEEQEMKVSRLIPILHCCKPSTETDYYQLHSIILLLDFSIGNEILSASERMDLDQIIKKLREMVGEIRDNSLSMSMSQVKSLIVRTATKLSFMTQAMVTKQEGVFSFLRRDNTESLELPEHHVSSQTDGASLPSDDESSAEMEGEEDEFTRSKDTGWSEDVECKSSGSENKVSKPSERVDRVPENVQAGSCFPNDINIEHEPANLTLDGEVATVLATGKKIKEEKLGAESPAKKLKVGTMDNLHESVPPTAADKTGQLVENSEAETSLLTSRMKSDVIDLTCSDEDNDNDDDSIECVN